MHTHGNRQSVAADCERLRKEKLIEAMADRLDHLLQNKLPITIDRLKGDGPRHAMPEPRMLFSDAIRGHCRPAHPLGRFVARMIVNGLSHHDARVFVAQLVGWVDAEYMEHLPPLNVLAPQLVRENGEATAAQMVAMVDPCRANLDRALVESDEAIALQEITRRRLAQDKDNAEKLRATAKQRLSVTAR